MTTTLTPGRWSGLRTTSTHEDVFSILAFDQRNSYRKMLPEETSYDAAVALKQEIVTALTQYASAVLVDPVYGLPSALNRSRGSGLLMSYEKSGYTGVSTYRELHFDADWTIAKIKNMGASAVKLMVYYHPDSGELAEKNERIIAEIRQECHAHDIPIFLEPMSYSLDESISKSSQAFADARPRVIIETARRLGALGCDVLKLEFPYDAAFHDNRGDWARACAQVSEACEAPWVLLSAGVDFPIFEAQATVACQNGASGWLAGRAIWKEAVTMTPDQRREFLDGEASARIQGLIDIANMHGRPWTDFYTHIPNAENWAQSYG